MKMVLYGIFKMAPMYFPLGGGNFDGVLKNAKNCMKWNKFDWKPSSTPPLDSPLMSEHHALTTSRSVTFRYVFLSVASVNTQGLWVSLDGLHFVTGASFTSPRFLIVKFTVVIPRRYLSVVLPRTTYWNLNVNDRNNSNTPTTKNVVFPWILNIFFVHKLNGLIICLSIFVL